MQQHAPTIVRQPVGSAAATAAEGAPAPATFAEGAYCGKTQRVAIVSPHPDRLHELLREMSASCFDVLVFRRLSSLLESGAINDAYLFDLSAGDPYGDAAAIGAYVAERGIRGRTLFIRSADTSDSLLTSGAAIAWPCAISEAMVALYRTLAQEAEQPQASADALAAAGESPTPTSSARMASRLQPQAESVHLYKDLQVDMRRMVVEQAGRPVELTKTEYDLLVHLLEEQGAVVSRQAMMERMWGNAFAGGSNAVDVHIRALRRKLGDKPVTSRYIVTVRGVGYRMADIR